MDSKLQSNLWKITISDVFYRFGVIGSVYILYFTDYLGFSKFHIGLFEGITSLTIVASDLFTGVIADRIGRKNSVLLSNLAFFIMAILLGVVGWISSGLLVILIVSGILNGLEFSFRSGARSALLYDTLIQLNQEKDYLKISGRINAIGIISNVLGMAVGGILLEIFPPLPYWIWSGFIFVSSIILITVQEPVIQKSDKNSSFWEEVKFGVKYIFKSKTLLWLVLFFLFADVFAEGYWDIHSQDHLETLGATPTQIGIVLAIISAVCAIVSYFIEKIEKRVGQKWMLYGIIGIQVILFVAIAWVSHWYTLATVLFIFNINRNFAWLLSDSYRNKIIPSEHRATILSAASFLNNGLFGGGILLVVIGWFIENVENSILFTFFAVIILVLNGGLLLVRDIRKRRKLSTD